MSSKRARSSPSERQVQSNGVKQSLTHNDSIERLVDELLDSGKGKIKSSETGKALSDNQKANIEIDQANCEHCRSYFPLLKSFILHAENCHKGTVTDGQVESYKCDLCKLECDSAVALGMHSLLHVCGKPPSKETHVLPAVDVNVHEGVTEQSETTMKTKTAQSGSQNKHATTRMYTRLIQQFSKDSADKIAEEDVAGDNVGAVGSEVPNPLNTRATLSPRKKRGRPSKAQTFNIGASVAEGPSIAPSCEIPSAIQSNGKTTLIEISNLIPSLQDKGIGMNDKTSDALVIDNIIRPRECTSSSLEDGESTTSIAYEKNIESIQIVQENGLKDDAFEVQETNTVEEAPSSQFIVNKNDVSKVDNYHLVQATSNDTAPKM